MNINGLKFFHDKIQINNINKCKLENCSMNYGITTFWVDPSYSFEDLHFFLSGTLLTEYGHTGNLHTKVINVKIKFCKMDSQIYDSK